MNPMKIKKFEDEPEIKITFPLLLRKDGKPKKHQKPICLSYNMRFFIFERGKEFTVPHWIKELCDNANIEHTSKRIQP